MNVRKVSYYEKLLQECITIEKWAETKGWYFVEQAKIRTNEVRKMLELVQK